MDVRDFQELIWHKGRELYRNMPWREDTRPYYVLVSELMLQQTQVAQVIPKFRAFVAAFPDEQALARASLADVLRAWQGLGYNRRAKYLHDAAAMIVHEYGGDVPAVDADLRRLPGVGANTAGAIMAYSYSQPSIFVETNVRTVYVHHFFGKRGDVRDSEIRSTLVQTIDREHPRQWYWALMDYGSWLKSQGVRTTHRNPQYRKQAPLAGSVREVRGRIVRELMSGPIAHEVLAARVQADTRFEGALAGLMRDGLG